MNLVLDGAFEVDVKKGTRKEIGTCTWISSVLIIKIFAACV